MAELADARLREGLTTKQATLCLARLVGVSNAMIRMLAVPLPEGVPRTLTKMFATMPSPPTTRWRKELAEALATATAWPRSPAPADAELGVLATFLSEFVSLDYLREWWEAVEAGGGEKPFNRARQRLNAAFGKLAAGSLYWSTSALSWEVLDDFTCTFGYTVHKTPGDGDCAVASLVRALGFLPSARITGVVRVLLSGFWLSNCLSDDDLSHAVTHMLEELIHDGYLTEKVRTLISDASRDDASRENKLKCLVCAYVRSVPRVWVGQELSMFFGVVAARMARSRTGAPSIINLDSLAMYCSSTLKAEDARGRAIAALGTSAPADLMNVDVAGLLRYLNAKLVDGELVLPCAVLIRSVDSHYDVAMLSDQGEVMMQAMRDALGFPPGLDLGNAAYSDALYQLTSTIRSKWDDDAQVSAIIYAAATQRLRLLLAADASAQPPPPALNPAEWPSLPSASRGGDERVRTLPSASRGGDGGGAARTALDLAFTENRARSLWTRVMGSPVGHAATPHTTPRTTAAASAAVVGARPTPDLRASARSRGGATPTPGAGAPSDSRWSIAHRAALELRVDGVAAALLDGSARAASVRDTARTTMQSKRARMRALAAQMRKDASARSADTSAAVDGVAGAVSDAGARAASVTDTVRTTTMLSKRANLGAIVRVARMRNVASALAANTSAAVDGVAGTLPDAGARAASSSDTVRCTTDGGAVQGSAAPSRVSVAPAVYDAADVLSPVSHGVAAMLTPLSGGVPTEHDIRERARVLYGVADESTLEETLAVWRGFNVTGQMLLRVERSRWLNDATIDLAAAHAYAERAKVCPQLEGRLWVAPIWLLNQYVRERHHGAVATFTSALTASGRNIFDDRDLLAFPWGSGNHFVLFVADMTLRVVVSYDSMGGAPVEQAEALVSYLRDEYRTLQDAGRTPRASLGSWRVQHARDRAPGQNNSVDCGVAVVAGIWTLIAACADDSWYSTLKPGHVPLPSGYGGAADFKRVRERIAHQLWSLPVWKPPSAGGVPESPVGLAADAPVARTAAQRRRDQEAKQRLRERAAVDAAASSDGAVAPISAAPTSPARSPRSASGDVAPSPLFVDHGGDDDWVRNRDDDWIRNRDDGSEHDLSRARSEGRRTSRGRRSNIDILADPELQTILKRGSVAEGDDFSRASTAKYAVQALHPPHTLQQAPDSGGSIKRYVCTGRARSGCPFGVTVEKDGRRWRVTDLRTAHLAMCGGKLGGFGIASLLGVAGVREVVRGGTSHKSKEVANDIGRVASVLPGKVTTHRLRKLEERVMSKELLASYDRLIPTAQEIVAQNARAAYDFYLSYNDQEIVVKVRHDPASTTRVRTTWTCAGEEMDPISDRSNPPVVTQYVALDPMGAQLANTRAGLDVGCIDAAHKKNESGGMTCCNIRVAGKYFVVVHSMHFAAESTATYERVLQLYREGVPDAFPNIFIADRGTALTAALQNFKRRHVFCLVHLKNNVFDACKYLKHVPQAVERLNKVLYARSKEAYIAELAKLDAAYEEVYSAKNLDEEELKQVVTPSAYLADVGPENFNVAHFDELTLWGLRSSNVVEAYNAESLNTVRRMYMLEAMISMRERAHAKAQDLATILVELLGLGAVRLECWPSAHDHKDFALKRFDEHQRAMQEAANLCVAVAILPHGCYRVTNERGEVFLVDLGLHGRKPTCGAPCLVIEQERRICPHAWAAVMKHFKNDPKSCWDYSEMVWDRVYNIKFLHETLLKLDAVLVAQADVSFPNVPLRPPSGFEPCVSLRKVKLQKRIPNRGEGQRLEAGLADPKFAGLRRKYGGKSAAPRAAPSSEPDLEPMLRLDGTWEGGAGCPECGQAALTYHVAGKGSGEQTGLKCLACETVLHGDLSTFVMDVAIARKRGAHPGRPKKAATSASVAAKRRRIGLRRATNPDAREHACGNCGEPGHNRRTCEAAQTGVDTDDETELHARKRRRVVRCSRCRLPGHYRSSCRGFAEERRAQSLGADDVGEHGDGNAPDAGAGSAGDDAVRDAPSPRRRAATQKSAVDGEDVALGERKTATRATKPRRKRALPPSSQRDGAPAKKQRRSRRKKGYRRVTISSSSEDEEKEDPDDADDADAERASPKLPSRFEQRLRRAASDSQSDVGEAQVQASRRSHGEEEFY